jgi:putative membrane-bound dehydrogenase-like protein
MRSSLFALVFTTSAFAAPTDLGPVRPLKVPAGFEVVKVAGPPLVDRPVVCCLDDKGRLYVADSSGSNEKPAVQLEKPSHRIVRLEDTDGDGVYDKSVVFADRMMFLQGVMWKDGSLFVGAPPHIWKLTDTDNDGKADKRDIWFDGKTLTGCANDLHGPYAGPDGYIYWTKGAFAKQEYTLPNGKKWASRCATILRAKPDGTGIEPVMTGGMDNPVDVVFLPNGERIFSTTFLQNPANGQRDGLIHAVYGAVYGKDHDPVYELPWTSPTLMPPMTHMGPAAPSGLHRYESDQLGKEFTGNLFCAQFNLRTVSRHILKPSGSTYVTEDSPYVTSDDVDFHPTDVFEDADGSLLVVDTGGWYKLCCPSSQLVKADVLGGIYRVKKIGSHKSKFKPPAEALTKLYWVSLNRDSSGFDLAVAGLQFSDYQTRRLAAEALGRIGDKRAVPVILKALEDEKNDHVLRHSLTYALIEIGDVAGTREGLKSNFKHVVNSTLVALNTMPGGLTGKDVAKYVRLDDSVDSQSDTAFWVITKQPEFASALIEGIDRQIQSIPQSLFLFSDGTASRDAENERRTQYRNIVLTRIAGLAQNPTVQEYLAKQLETSKRDTHAFFNVSEVMKTAKLKSIPESWFRAVQIVVSDESSPPAVEVGYELAIQFRNLTKTLPMNYMMYMTMLANDIKYQHRRLAQYSLPAEMFELDSGLLPKKITNEAIKAQKNHTPTIYLIEMTGSDFINLLKHFRVNEQELISTLTFLPQLESSDRQQYLTLFDRTRSEPVGLALVKALNTSEMRAKIRVEQVKPILDKYPASVKAEAEKMYAELEKSRAGEIAKFEALVKELPAGDVRRGQVVFHSQKANCKACHTIGYVGGKVGPDLTRIGGIRTERDLLESIVFPSASFVRSYEPVRVITKDGRTLNGNIKSDRPDEIVLTVAADQEVRIARENVEEVTPGQVSVMPSGLDQQISKQELADLVAFLKANK